jgi:Uma2 family endonuclease
MDTLKEIQRGLGLLTFRDRLAIARWLEEVNDAEAREYGVAEPAASYAATDPIFMTLEEFFEFEERSEIRHEYVDGVVFAMTNPSVVHERIRHRLVMAFGSHLDRGPCQVFSSTMRLLIQNEATEISYLPDVMVDCHRDTWGKNVVRSPKLVIEILSPSTQLIDRREKLHNYRLIDSVQEYAIAAQNEHKLTIYRRADGWRPEVCAGARSAAEFRSVELVLSLQEIYGDIIGG